MTFLKYVLASSLLNILRQSAIIAVALLSTAAYAQNPIPQIVGPVRPTAVAPGSGPFTLTVYGANFVPGAVVNWNYQAHTTTFVSARELQAQILSADVAQNGTGFITVTNPAPGGGISSASWAQVEVHTPVSTFVLNQPWVMQLPYSFGYGPVLMADMNGDRKLDLWSSGIEMLGNTAGTFRFGAITPNYHDPSGAVYGDFNGDGNIDLVYVEGDSTFVPAQQMLVMLGEGKGKFTKGSKISNWAGFGTMAAGDFNGDGKLDLAVTTGPDFLTIYLGNGDGTFQHFVDYPHVPMVNMVVGDFNNDGKLDLLASTTNDGTTYYVDLLMGRGDGTFQYPPKQIGSVVNGLFVDANDFNGDGNLDIVIWNQTQFGIQLGNGDGTFQAPTFYTVAPELTTFSYAVGDFNSDGKIDVIVSEYGNVNQFSMLLGNGDGTLQAPQMISLPGGYYGGLLAGDFNNDGLLDFLLIDLRYVGIVYTQQ